MEEEKAPSDIHGMIDALDADVEKGSAGVQFVIMQDEPDYPGVEANRLGFLRIASTFLKAALAPSGKEAAALHLLSENGLLTKESEIAWMSFRRREDFQSPGVKRTRLRPGWPCWDAHSSRSSL